jgi:hypothetical protein
MEMGKLSLIAGDAHDERGWFTENQVIGIRSICAAPVISTFRSPISAAELRECRANYSDQQRPNASGHEEA